jgi:hypothetical protein
MQPTLNPSIPSDWIRHTPIVQPSGTVPHCLALHKAHEGSYHPFVSHVASFRDDAWTYSNGNYFFTLDEAIAAFTKRASTF